MENNGSSIKNYSKEEEGDYVQLAQTGIRYLPALGKCRMVRQVQMNIVPLPLSSLFQILSIFTRSITDALFKIGGGEYPKGMLDFNAKNDLNAANVIIASPIELWQIPMSAYTMMEVSFHELFDRIGTCGDIGHYLMQNLLRVNEKECANTYEHWPFYAKVSKGNERTVRVYHNIDSRIILEDMFAKIRYHYH
jgi:hypothetical protein